MTVRTIKILALSVGLALLGSGLFVATNVASAQEATPDSRPGDGVISGTVSNGTTESTGNGVLVTLSIFNSDGFVADLRTTTDDQGTFEFSGLNPDPALTYSLTASSQGVGYSSGPLAFSADADHKLNVDLQVYNSTRDRSLITISQRAIIMTDISPTQGEMSLLDVVVLNLNGTDAYVPDDAGRSVEFPVPRNASKVTPFPGSDYNLGNATIEGATVFADTPLLPGESTATLGYSIPYTTDSLGVELVNAYATEQIRILIPTTIEGFDQGLIATGADLTDAGQQTIGPQTYQVWTTDASGAGVRTNIVYDNLPQSSIDPNTLRKFEPVALSVVAVILAIAIIGVVVYRRQLFRPRPVSLAPAMATSLDERRTDLIAQLRALETAHEQALIPDESYGQYRRTILEHLRTISRRQQGLGDDG